MSSCDRRYVTRRASHLIRALTFNLAFVGVAAIAGGCGSSPEPAVVQPDDVQVPAPDLGDGDVAAPASSGLFALDLYKVLRDDPGNLFFSPHSISAALAMTYAGARGDTELEMADVLHFELAQPELHQGFNALDLELGARSLVDPEGGGDPFQLNISNSIWGQEGFELLQQYMDTLALNYGAGLRPVDFVASPELARETINDWVSEQTEERIPDLIPEGVIDDLTRLVLANAIYFNASWAVPFDERATELATFHLLNGEEILVPMMNGRGPATSYALVEGVEAVELPYAGGDVSFVILLPPEGEFASFESSLDANSLEELIGNLERADLNLRMPRFEFESDLSLADPLQALGMTSAFDWLTADFSGITGDKGLYIKDVVHGSFVSVDESGTEASAATAVGVAVMSAPPVVTVDRPFIFLIRDIPTDTILFLGRVITPS